MALFLAGMALFFGTHVFSAVRPRGSGADLRETMGEAPFMATYSVVALIGFGLMVYGYGEARPSSILYVAPAWGRVVNMVLMIPALILLAAAYAPTGYIKAAAKHPMLAAVKLWALGHLLANGELTSVILFGAFLAYGVIARIAAKRRGDAGPGPDAPRSLAGDAAALVVGIGAYAALALYLHPILFGVAAVA